MKRIVYCMSILMMPFSFISTMEQNLSNATAAKEEKRTVFSTPITFAKPSQPNAIVTLLKKAFKACKQCAIRYCCCYCAVGVLPGVDNTPEDHFDYLPNRLGRSKNNTGAQVPARKADDASTN